MYFLGLSFGAVSSALDVLRIYLCKSQVHDAVQVAMTRWPQLTRRSVFEAIRRRDLHSTVLLVKCMDDWLPLTLVTDACSRLVLAVDTLSEGDIVMLRERIKPLITAMGGQVLVVDSHAASEESHQRKPDHA
jgi:hypothetical protein